MSGSISSHSRPYFEQHGGFYRSVDDVSSTWRASPILDKPKPAPYFYVKFSVPELPLPTTKTLWSATVASGEHTNPIHPKQRKRILRLLRKLVSPKAAKRSSLPSPPSTDAYSPSALYLREPDVELIPLREWKAWGYYARPVVNGVTVRNYPPSSDISSRSSIDFEDLFESLRDLDNSVHPERWIPGVQHPSLPPRPSLWHPPIRGQPNLFPWELQLNPFLQHRPVGSAPLCWNLNQQVQLYGHVNAFWLDEQDLAQPATYPFVTHMYINGIADFPWSIPGAEDEEDREDRFPWPVMIRNYHGITCGDVFNAIFEALNQHVSEEEYQSWVGRVYGRDAAQAAYGIRKLRDGEEDGMRRVDLLGFSNFFRGLEPHPNREGWMLFTGLA